MLRRNEILFLLDLLSQKTIVEESKDFPYRISCKAMGYSDDKQTGALQAKLSIMLEAARA